MASMLDDEGLGTKIFDLTKRSLSDEEIKTAKESAAYVLKRAGLTYADGGTFTEQEFLKAFGGYSPEVFDVLKNERMLVIVEQELESSVRYGGPSGDFLTYNPWANKVPPRLLECGNTPGSIKESSPKKRIAEIISIIEESFKDTEPFRVRISELEGYASSLYRDTISKRAEDARVKKLKEDGGFRVVSDGAEKLKKTIEAIETAKEFVDGYTISELETALEVLKSAEVSDRFYRGKPPLTMKQSETKSGAEHLLTGVYRKVFVPQKLARKDVEKYLKEWKETHGKAKAN